MKVIGVTGGIGSGKSFVSALFAECGAVVVDADRIAKEIMGPGSPALRETTETFGEEILRPDGTLDRKRLADTVFRSAEKLESLNRITHKYIFEEMRRQMEAVPADGVAVLDVPLLFGADFPFRCDRTVAVVADRELRVARVAERDGTDREGVLRRMANQLSDEEYRRRADVCLDNSGGAEELRREVQKIYLSVRNEKRA